MRNKRITSLLTTIVISILSIIFILGGSLYYEYKPTVKDNEKVETAEVVSNVNKIKIQNEEDGSIKECIRFKGKLTSGKNSGEIFLMEQEINDVYLPKPKEVALGDKILVADSSTMGSGNGEAKYFYVGTNRLDNVFILVGVFCLLIIIFGKLKGLATLFSLGITIAVIFTVYIPAILCGENIYLLTAVVGAFIIFVDLIILNGLNKKTFCAIVGNIGGIIIAGAFAYLVNDFLSITGMIDQDYMYLTSISSKAPIDLKAIVWGAIIIGSLGAIMDVAMSIASAMYELSIEMKNRTFKRLVKSGMNIGRDTIGTMTNTLILAYVGGSLATILLFVAFNKNLLILMNYELVIVEIIQAVVGSIGILLAVPTTVIFSAWLLNKNTQSPVELLEGE